MTQPNLGIEVAAPTAREVNLIHAKSDVDTDPSAQHHTLGIRHDQSSPGDHNHDGTTSKSITYPTAAQVDPLGIYQTNGSIPLDTDFGTDSVSWVDMPGFILTISAAAGDKLIILFSSTLFQSSNNFTNWFAMIVGGVSRKSMQHYIPSAGVAETISFHTAYTVLPADIVGGLVTVKMAWRTNGGTINCTQRPEAERPTLTIIKGMKVNGQIGGDGAVGSGGGEGSSGGNADEVYIGDYAPSGGRELWVDTLTPSTPGGNCWILPVDRWAPEAAPFNYENGTSLMNATTGSWPAVPSEIITYKDGPNCSQECRVAITNSVVMRNWDGVAGAWKPWINALVSPMPWARMYSSGHQLVPSNVWTRLPVDQSTLRNATGTFTFDDAANQMNILKSGIYLITGHVTWEPEAGHRYVRLRLAGSVFGTGQTYARNSQFADGVGQEEMTVHQTTVLDAPCVVGIDGYQTCGRTIYAMCSLADEHLNTWVEITRLSDA